MTRFHWHGHSAWTVEHSGTRLLIDPFFSGNPAADMTADKVQADFILLSHAHGDHLGDTVDLARRLRVPVVTNNEISHYLTRHGVEHTHGLNPGGGVQLPFGRVTFVRADHSSSFPDGTYGGVACGFVVHLDDLTLYNAGDTALFTDMEWFGERYKPDVVMLPIGDYFTMGPEDAHEAVRLINPRVALPQHFNTFPPIRQDGKAWAERVYRDLRIEAPILEPGQSAEV